MPDKNNVLELPAGKSFRLKPEVVAKLQKRAHRKNISVEELLEKAIALYETSDDAVNEQKLQVAFVDDRDRVAFRVTRL